MKRIINFWFEKGAILKVSKIHQRTLFQSGNIPNPDQQTSPIMTIYRKINPQVGATKHFFEVAAHGLIDSFSPCLAVQNLRLSAMIIGCGEKCHFNNAFKASYDFVFGKTGFHRSFNNLYVEAPTTTKNKLAFLLSAISFAAINASHISP